MPDQEPHKFSRRELLQMGALVAARALTPKIPAPQVVESPAKPEKTAEKKYQSWLRKSEPPKTPSFGETVNKTSGISTKPEPSDIFCNTEQPVSDPGPAVSMLNEEIPGAEFLPLALLMNPFPKIGNHNHSGQIWKESI